MAVSVGSRGDITDASQTTKNHGQILIWLDDTAEEEDEVKEVFLSLFDNVFIFTNPDACLDLIESMDIKTPCLSILTSGKYGQMLVRDRLQPLIQIKYIYIFCFDTVKHGRWAQTCDKVRCVFSEINKIVQCMQFDMQDTFEQQQQELEEQQQQQQQDDQPSLPESPKLKPYRRERFTDDYNIFDYLAVNLLFQSSDDGIEDFTDYCETHQNNNESDHAEMPQLYFNPDQTIQEWYRSDLVFLDINSNDLMKLWKLRWFIRHFHKQLIVEQEKINKDQTKFTTYHGQYLTADEFDAMKHRIGQTIIITESLFTYTNRQTTLNSIHTIDENKHKVVFEINIDSTIRETIPYGRIRDEETVLWFGGRYQLFRIEYIDEPDPYWLICLNLCPTLDSNSSIQTLYDYYLKELIELNNIYHAFGRILIYKGAYIQAETWLQSSNHYQELAELALRQNHYEQAKYYLEHLPEDCDETNLLRVYFYLLTMSNDYSKIRLILLKILSQATDKLLRARVNIVFGFINLIHTQQIDQAFEYFTVGNEVLRTLLPSIHPDLARSFLGIGYTYFSQHNIIEAKKNFQIAFNIQKQSLIYNHPDLAKTRNGLAHCSSSDKQTIKHALNESEYALNILLDTYQSEDHPEILATRDDIEQLRKGKELFLRQTLFDYI
ncbi:hypothetical protein I4U23_009672 [Adineta vaga]|nr:hypothetical protein I4U23_009672 [Adineta vaga]